MDLRARHIKGPERSRNHEDWDDPLFVDSILNGPTPPPTESKPADDDAALTRIPRRSRASWTRSGHPS